MGRAGRGSNVLLMAAQAATNPRMRPRRRRELHLQALDYLWNLYAPPPGSRLKKFRTAFKRVLTTADNLGIEAHVLDDWADALVFEVDDRDDHEPQ